MDADKVGFIGEHAVQSPRAGGVSNGHVEESLDRPTAGIFVDDKVQQIGFRYAEASCDLIGDAFRIHGVNHGIAPSSGTGGFELHVVLLGLGGILLEPDDDGLAATVTVKIANGIAQRVTYVQSAELAFEVAEAIDDGRIIHWPARGASNKSRDRRGDPGDSSDSAGNFFDVNPWIGWCDWHDETSKVSETVLRPNCCNVGAEVKHLNLGR